MAEARRYLGNRCSRCGDPYCKLYFHHVDPALKVERVTALFSHAAQVFWDEVEKCILLCRSCHVITHAEEELAPRPVLEAAPF